MTTKGLALYEALKPKIGAEGARMIAEVVPETAELATKADIVALEQRIDRLEARFLRWTLAFFLPLWLAVLAALVAVVLRT